MSCRQNVRQNPQIKTALKGKLIKNECTSIPLTKKVQSLLAVFIISVILHFARSKRFQGDLKDVLFQICEVLLESSRSTLGM